MSLSLATVGRHFLASRPLLQHRQVQRAIAIAAIVGIISIVLAPDASPTTWDWFRILLVGCLGASSVLMFVTAQSLTREAPDRRPRLAIAAALVALALLINLTFALGTALIFSIGFTVIVVIATGDGAYRTMKVIAGALIATIPFWTWSALETWTWGLLLLIPLAGIGVVSDGHMRAALGPPADDASHLSARAHRLAGWLGVLGSALIALIAAVATDASNGVAALGAVGAIVLVGLEAGSRQPSAPANTGSSVTIVDAALLWVALCWIVSL